MSELPSNWASARLTEVALINPKSLDQAPTENELVSFVPMAAVQEESGSLDASTLRPWRDVSKGYTRFQENDVLFAKITPCMENGKYALAKGLHGGRGAGSTEFHVFRPSEALDPKLLLFFLFQPHLRRAARLAMRGAAGQLRVPPEFFSTLEVNLPPRSEQSRIVAEIEKQFTRLDDAVAALKRVQANLKRYRASVLKAACEGRLVPTEAELARRERRDYEPSSELLKRILAERRSKWEADQLRKMIAAGKPPKDEEWKAKYRQPITADLNGVPPVPEGWIWTSLDAVLLGIEAGRSFKCEERPPEQDEIGVVKVSAVTWGEFDEQESKTCLDSSRHDSQFLINEGDFLFSRANTIELVGACVIVKSIHNQLMLSDKILRFRLASSMLPEWILYVLRSEWGRYEIERLSTGNQESMRNIGQDRIRSIRIPIPPARELLRILTELDLRATAATECSISAGENVTRAARLRNAVLVRAFSGKLVPQDPHEEPASVLLERIRAERARAQTRKEKNQRESHDASPVTGQRRRRVEELAQSVRPGKG